MAPILSPVCTFCDFEFTDRISDWIVGGGPVDLEKIFFWSVQWLAALWNLRFCDMQFLLAMKSSPSMDYYSSFCAITLTFHRCGWCMISYCFFYESCIIILYIILTFSRKLLDDFDLGMNDTSFRLSSACCKSTILGLDKSSASRIWKHTVMLLLFPFFLLIIESVMQFLSTPHTI